LKRINGCAKGKRIERLAAKYLQSLGFIAERNARNGLSTADLNCDECPVLSKVHLEIKGDESIDVGTKALDDAMEQAYVGAMHIGANGFPQQAMDKPYAVLWKRKNKGWRLTFTASSPPVLVTVDAARIKQSLIWLSGTSA
jgi:hypothetical protein